MRIRFQEKPWDLYWLIGYSAVVGGAVLVLGVGSVAAVPLTLFIPGYFLVAALFPGRKDIGWIERIGLSLGLSIAIVPLHGLALNATPFVVRSFPVVALLLAFCVLVGVVAFWRRVRLPVAERLSVMVDFTFGESEMSGLLDKVLFIATIATVLVATGTLAYLIATPKSGERFTEFYVLGGIGDASNYPTALNTSQPESVILGIVNHEGTTANYSVSADLVGVRIVYNATSGFNETVEANRTTLSAIRVRLSDNENWTKAYTFSVSYVGLWKVQFLLFKDDDFSSAYRELHIYVRVT